MSILDLPETRYAECDGLHIAYQELGDGPLNFVVVMGLWSHLDFWHEVPGYTDFLRGLGQMGRVVVFDKRGYGLSDRWPRVPTLEERMDDVRAVMDTVGMEQAAVLAWSEGVPLSLLFASTYPERVTHLLLFDGAARWPEAPGYTGMSRQSVEAFINHMVNHWGTTQSAQTIDTRISADPELAALYAKGERMCLRQNEVEAAIRWVFDVDVRDLLPHVRVPTLVMAREESVLVEQGRYLHRHIAGAELALFESNWHAPWGIGDEAEILARIEAFLGTPAQEGDIDRTLATVLSIHLQTHTGESERTPAGLRREIVRSIVELNRGTIVRGNDEAFVATFDGPGRAIACATKLREKLAALDGISFRAGIHTGEVTVTGGRLSGAAVELAEGVRHQAAPGEVLVSRTVVDLVVGSGLQFERRGVHELRRAGESWTLYAVPGDHEPARRVFPDGLSEREVEILQLLAQGKRNSEIARELGISAATVTRHVSNILGKTGRSNRTEAAAYAIAHALIDSSTGAVEHASVIPAKHLERTVGQGTATTVRHTRTTGESARRQKGTERHGYERGDPG